MGLQPHQERVVAEKQELDQKIAALTAFMQSEKFKDVGPAEQARLKAQLVAMQPYSDILAERIAAFS